MFDDCGKLVIIQSDVWNDKIGITDDWDDLIGFKWQLYIEKVKKNEGKQEKEF